MNNSTMYICTHIYIYERQEIEVPYLFLNDIKKLPFIAYCLRVCIECSFALYNLELSEISFYFAFAILSCLYKLRNGI